MAAERKPTRQGFQHGGPDNARALPPRDAPGPDGTGERPFDPRGGTPAKDPAATAEALLRRANPGPAAPGDAGPESAQGGAQPGDGPSRDDANPVRE